MCNCSNFDGGDGYENIGSENHLYGNATGGVDRHANEYVDNEDISFENYDGDDEDDEDDEDMMNYSEMHEEDSDMEMDEGGSRAYSKATGEYEDWDNYEDEEDEDDDDDDMDGFADDDYDNFTDDEFGGADGSFAKDGDEQYDEFFTKRARARRKLRKKLKKQGLTRKERRKQALASIPKQKLGKLIGFAVRGKTDPETTKILKNLEAQGVIDPKKDGLTKVAEEISASLSENEQEGTQNLGTDIPTSTTPVAPAVIGSGGVTQAGGGKKKMMMMVVIGVVVLVGGYFAFKKFK